MSFAQCAAPSSQMRRGRLTKISCCHLFVDGPERQSGRNASPSGITPSNIMSPIPEPTRGSWTEVRLGARAHDTQIVDRAHGPPAGSEFDQTWPTLDTDLCTSKEIDVHHNPNQVGTE